MDPDYYRKFIKKKVKGKKRGDSTNFFQKEVLQNAVKDLSKKISKIKFDKVAGIDALGFVIGGAMAMHLKKGFIPIRKSGKLPLKKSDISKVYFKDYLGKRKSFELNKKSISKNDKIILVDNWTMTGAQIRYAKKLIEKSGGKVVGICVIGLEKNNKTKKLPKEIIFSLLEVQDRNR